MKFRFSRKKNKGVAAIEFAIGFIFFWYMCAAWIELSFMSYVSGIGDLAISHAAQVAKRNDGDAKDFITIFNNELKASNSIWKYIADSGKFMSSVTYLTSYDNLVKYDGVCEPDESKTTVECNSAEEAAIAVYRIEYNYSPMFNLFLDETNVLSREMIVIQEYQRNEFFM